MGDGESGAENGQGGATRSADGGQEEAPQDTDANRTSKAAPPDGEDPVPGRKIRRLHEVATAMQTATSVDEIYDLTVEAAVDILGFDWCAVELAVEGYFEVAAVSEEAPLGVGARPITTDHGVTGDVYMRGESNIIRDAHADPDADPTLEEFRSGLTVPMGDRGVFQGISSERHFFDEDDLELAELLIAHTRAALDRIEETERLNELNRATRQLMTAETHEAVAREGCDIASSVLNAPLTTVYHRDGDRLVPMAATDAARDVLDGPAVIEGEDDPVWRTMADGTAVRWRDGTGEDAWERLHVPLGEHGVLCVGSPVQGAFDENDVALAETLAANIEAAFTRADREQRRREQAEQLQRQNERLDRFASIVSHDLRNPLHIAATRAALAREERDSEHLVSLEDALERMETIIDDTLSLARQGRTAEETEPVPLSRVASRAWDQVETRGAGLEIVSDGVVQADQDRLQSVFENLFRNAVEHGADGEPERLSVRIGLLPDGFFVEDTGRGIPADRHGAVFDLGYSGDADGTGFGLAIVKEIVESHDWEVAVAASGEGGARFEISGVNFESGVDGE